MTELDLTATLTALLARTPQWIRHDLAASDAAKRARAEESLAAMIAAAIAGHIDGHG